MSNKSKISYYVSMLQKDELLDTFHKDIKEKLGFDWSADTYVLESYPPKAAVKIDSDLKNTFEDICNKHGVWIIEY